MIIKRLVLSLSLAVGLSVACQAGSIRYRVETIPPLPATNPRSQANAINELGQVTGLANVPDNSEAFLYENGTVTRLGNLGLGGGFTNGSGINNAGVVVGTGSIASGTGFSDRAFVWQPGLGYTAVLDPGNVGLGSNANAVNNLGLVVGVYRYRGFDRQGFVYRVGDSPSELILLPFLPESDPANGARQFANAINDSGVIAGAARTVVGALTQAVRWTPNGPGTYVIETLTQPTTTTTFSNSFGINNLGQIVGSYTDGGVESALLWNPDGSVQVLGLPSGASGSVARDINNRGVIVGDIISASGNSAFVYRNGQMTDLNSLIVGPNDFLRLTNARSINDRGQIVGFGQLRQGGIRGFVLTAIPEPPAIALGTIACVSATFVRLLHARVCQRRGPFKRR